MKAILKTHTTRLITLSIFVFICLLFILYQVNINIAEALNVDHLKFTLLDYAMGFGYLCLVVFHMYAIIYLFGHFHRVHTFIVLKIVVAVLGIISLFALGAQKVLIDDIARQSRLGLAVSEIWILNGTYFINITFTMLMLILLFYTSKLLSVRNDQRTPVDEIVFTIAHCMGVLSGIMGIWLTFNLIEKNIPRSTFWIYIPFYLLFFLPYALSIIYWFFCKSTRLISGWYDEKQFQDMLKSSLTTLLFSIPGLAVLVFFQIPDPVYWLVYYIFFILLIFSISTLYFFKIKDNVCTSRVLSRRANGKHRNGGE